MSAEEQIRHLMGRYIQAHDTHDVESIVALFTDDGLFANQNGETASALTDVVGFGRSGEAPWSVRLVAQYDDRFVHRNGEWRYAEKHVLG